MTAQHSIFSLVGIALAFAIGLAIGAPAAADDSQWTIKQPHWWDSSGGWSQNQWQGQTHHQQHHQQHFNNNIHRCFGSCFGSAFVFNGGNVVFVSPGIAFASPSFVIRQPSIVVRNPNDFAVSSGRLIAKQRAFFMRHPSLQLGRPMHLRHNGMRIIAPGM